MNTKTICIFASSSDDLEEIYYKDAKLLGSLMAKNGYDIVYGGSNLGLMGSVTASAIEEGSHITGVMPEKLYNVGIKEGNCSKFIVTKGMRERKAKMDELSQAIIALPGGFGTLEELTEMIVQKQLGYNSKAIVLLNTNNYYDNLINFFNDIIGQKFANNDSKKLYFLAKNPTEAIEYINNYKEYNSNYLELRVGLKN